MRCPRRNENPQADHMFPGGDLWAKRNCDSPRSCSFCGSMHPDDVIKAIEEGANVCPTDKNYKIYVGEHRKAYFQHFEQRHIDRFIELHNTKAMKVDYPGHFYVTPYFAIRDLKDKK